MLSWNRERNYMDKIATMLSRLVQRGQSEDDLGEKRSAQSTPRMGRSRVRDMSQESQKSYGSLGSMEAHRVRPRDRSWESEHANVMHKSLELDRMPTGLDRKSWDLERLPGGLDRSWEIERARGLEMLYQSVEREKQRREIRTRDQQNRQQRGRSKKKKRDRSKEQSDVTDYNNRMCQERLERHIQQLTQQLLEEKQLSRRDKLAVARLQQQLARHKSRIPRRESVHRDLERERMLRVDAERRLREMTIESDNCKSRLQALQEELRRMEEMVRSMLQYKKKIDHLKQEKGQLIVNYENNLQKYRSQLGNLEHENMILHAEVKKLEAQCSSSIPTEKDLSYRVAKQCSSPQADENDRSKMLLERLKMLEAEKSALVLENENQRQQYEKCLDQIANQVVQALISQKCLREECGKLQRRVADLEQQNRQLNQMIQQRLCFASDSVLQSLNMKMFSGRCTWDRKAVNTTSCSSASLPTQTQTTYVLGQMPKSPQSLENGGSPLSQLSVDSLQSLCSDYYQQSQFEESLGKAELSSPPPWLREKLLEPGSPTSSIASPAESTKAPSSSCLRHKNSQQVLSTVSAQDDIANDVNTSGSFSGDTKISDKRSDQGASKIETEFPVNNSSPKVRVSRQHGRDLGEVKPQHGGLSTEHTDLSLESYTSAFRALCDKIQKVNHQDQNLVAATHIISPGQELLKLSDPFVETFTLSEKNGLPVICDNNLIDSDSDDDNERSRPLSKTLSFASSLSLNELLEGELDYEQTPSDDNLSLENFDLDMTAGDMGGSKQSKDEANKSQKLNMECLVDIAQDNTSSLTSSHDVVDSAQQGKTHVIQRPNSLDLSDNHITKCNHYSSSSSDSEIDSHRSGPHRSMKKSKHNNTHVEGSEQPDVATETRSDLKPTETDVLSRKSTDQKPLISKIKPPLRPKPHRRSTQDSGIMDSQEESPKDSRIELDLDKGSVSFQYKEIAVDSGKDVQGSVAHAAGSSSPDSAMQQSFSSTSSGSDNALVDKPSNRDDGYSSNSAASFSLTDARKEQPLAAKKDNSIFDNPKLSLAPLAEVRQVSGAEPTFNSAEKLSSSSKGVSHGSLSSEDNVDAVTSVKVKDMKAFFECKMAECGSDNHLNLMRSNSQRHSSGSLVSSGNHEVGKLISLQGDHVLNVDHPTFKPSSTDLDYLKCRSRDNVQLTCAQSCAQTTSNNKQGPIHKSDPCIFRTNNLKKSKSWSLRVKPKKETPSKALLQRTLSDGDVNKYHKAADGKTFRGLFRKISKQFRSKGKHTGHSKPLQPTEVETPWGVKGQRLGQHGYVGYLRIEPQAAQNLASPKHNKQIVDKTSPGSKATNKQHVLTNKPHLKMSPGVSEGGGRTGTFSNEDNTVEVTALSPITTNTNTSLSKLMRNKPQAVSPGSPTQPDVGQVVSGQYSWESPRNIISQHACFPTTLSPTELVVSDCLSNQQTNSAVDECLSNLHISSASPTYDNRSNGIQNGVHDFCDKNYRCESSEDSLTPTQSSIDVAPIIREPVHRNNSHSSQEYKDLDFTSDILYSPPDETTANTNTDYLSRDVSRSSRDPSLSSPHEIEASSGLNRPCQYSLPHATDSMPEKRSLREQPINVCPQTDSRFYQNGTDSNRFANGDWAPGSMSDWSPDEEPVNYSLFKANYEDCSLGEEYLSPDLEDFSRTFNELQRSLSSLSSFGEERDEGRAIGESKLSESKELMLRETDVTDPEARAELLDKLVAGSFSGSDSGDEQSPGLDNALVDQLKANRKRKGGKRRVIRYVYRPRPAVDFRTFFSRYEEEDTVEALSAFSFLDKLIEDESADGVNSRKQDMTSEAAWQPRSECCIGLGLTHNSRDGHSGESRLAPGGAIAKNIRIYAPDNQKKKPQITVKPENRTILSLRNESRRDCQDIRCLSDSQSVP